MTVRFWYSLQIYMVTQRHLGKIKISGLDSFRKKRTLALFLSEVSDASGMNIPAKKSHSMLRKFHFRICCIASHLQIFK